MPRLTIDGRAVEVPDGTTVLAAAAKLGIEIPTLCFHTGWQPETSCLVCLVRVGGDRLVPACAVEVAEGMAVESETEEVRAARRMALELLLGDHLGDCLGPCQTICPAHMDIPRMVRLIAAGRLAEAVAVVKERIPFPAVLGRICPELCERGCRRKDVDSPVAIRLLKQYVGDYDLTCATPYTPERRPPSGKRVAIIGAGPAGLSAAYYLFHDGHECTVFDDRQHLGGMLRYGVPEAHLPREVLDAEIAGVVGLGLEVRPPTRVGQGVSLDMLRADFDAVLVATGEEGAQDLGLPMASGHVQADRRTQMTPVEGVFAAGSALAPSRHVVRAVGSGRTAAEAIHQYLAGLPVTGAERPFNVRLDEPSPEHLAALAESASRESRVSPQEGDRGSFVADEASRETERCLGCDCTGLGDCQLRLWGARYGANPQRHREEPRAFDRDATHPSLVYESGKCIACGLCVQIAARAGEGLGLAHVGRGFTVRVGVPFEGTMAQALESAALTCAEACPTGALRVAPRLRRL